MTNLNRQVMAIAVKERPMKPNAGGNDIQTQQGGLGDSDAAVFSCRVAV